VGLACQHGGPSTDRERLMVVLSIPKRPVIIPLQTAPPAPGEKQIDNSINLETNEYIVRTVLPRDVTDEFLEWFNKAEMLRGLNLENLNFTLESLRSFVSRFDNFHNYFLGIFSGDALVGFYTIDVNRHHKIGSITTGIGDKHYLGKHVLWSTIDAVIDHFYETRDIEKFTARILARNYAMLFNFKNNPRFELEGHLKQECRASDGKRLDILLFASYKYARGGKEPHRVAPNAVVRKK
jgi:RimJ/RimL family protein N-acetyltransferase